MKDLTDLINKGHRNRTVASTNMNRESSRSNAIFTTIIRTMTVDQDNQKTVRTSLTLHRRKSENEGPGIDVSYKNLQRDSKRSSGPKQNQSYTTKRINKEQ